MNDDRVIDYKTEYNRLINELSKLRLSYAELENDRDYIQSLLDAEFEKGLKLKKENEELKQTIDCICKDYENHHGMDIKNAEWFTAW